MRHLLIPAILWAGSTALAQRSAIVDHDWDPVPTIPAEVRSGAEGTVLLKRHILSEYVDDPELGFHSYVVFHLQRIVRDAANVEKHTTVEVGTDRVMEMVRIKARTIAPDGTVRELDPSAFKNVEDEDGRKMVRFAFEGLEPGGVTEYILHTRESTEFRGTRINLQFGTPVLDERWELFVPRTWKVQVRSYNGPPEAGQDTSIAGLTRYHVQLRNVPAQAEEPHSFPDAHAQYLVHKLDRVEGTDNKDLSSYRTIVGSYHDALYPELTSKARKALDAYLKTMRLAFARDLEDKVRTIEDHVKTEFRLVENGSGKDLTDLESVLEDHTCSPFGMHRLMCNLLRAAGVDHQLVITSDRTELPFDPTFEALLFLQDQHLYIPALDKYMAPTALQLRLGYLPAKNMGTKAVFVRNVEIGGAFKGITSIKEIPFLPDSASFADLDLDVRLSADAFDATIAVEERSTGYLADVLQVFHSYMNEEQRTSMIDRHLEHLVLRSSSHAFTVENAESELFGKRPLVIKGEVLTSNFSSLAGERVLFRIGELIGPQVELYTDTVRTLPVDDLFNRAYHRTIRFNIPAGWTVGELNELNIERRLEIDGEPVLLFRSTATRNGDVVVVDVVERYRRCHLPVDRFADYRAVINAAADLTKAALVLSRTN